MSFYPFYVAANVVAFAAFVLALETIAKLAANSNYTFGRIGCWQPIHCQFKSKLAASSRFEARLATDSKRGYRDIIIVKSSADAYFN